MVKKRNPRDRVLAVKVTAAEKKKIIEYATEHSVNVSALVRKLLFDQLQKGDIP